MVFTEWPNGHYCTFSEDLGQPSPSCSSDRDAKVVADGRMAAQHHPLVERECGLEKMERLLTPVFQDMWLMCGSLLPCFPLSLFLRAFARYCWAVRSELEAGASSPP